MNTNRTIVLLSCVFLLCFSGCKPAGLKTYHISGNVYYGDQPVVEGVITFTPSTDDGNRGGQGVAFILDGKFDTKSGRGITAGSVTATISGSDRHSGTEGAQTVFAEYIEEFEMPEKDHVLDFRVPLNFKNKN